MMKIIEETAVAVINYTGKGTYMLVGNSFFHRRTVLWGDQYIYFTSADNARLEFPKARMVNGEAHIKLVIESLELPLVNDFTNISGSKADALKRLAEQWDIPYAIATFWYKPHFWSKPVPIYSFSAQFFE